MNYILLKSDTSKRVFEQDILGIYQKTNEIPSITGTELTLIFQPIEKCIFDAYSRSRVAISIGKLLALSSPNNWYVYEEGCLVKKPNHLIQSGLTSQMADDLLSEYRRVFPELTFMADNVTDNPFEYIRLKDCPGCNI